MTDITFVTGNKDKVRETEEILNISLAVAAIDLDEIQELDLEKVAKHKLQLAYNEVKKPVIIDDVSVVIHVWNTFPGPLIKWVLKASDGTPAMLLKMLGNETKRNATATLAIGFSDGTIQKIFYGKIEGSIGYEITGDNGFGWDKVFIPKGETRTLAQMPPSEKNQISHRRKALDQLKDFILQYKAV
ncbi:MAG: RdgB/HAM1 family non-canonical purine NTP pyrophosphatase [Candidatus Levybacteria bacterium]|nr:RdgB/HAM1 family non-canonical purine NTP pyrophosphatase [Candidatus Levybacteria bacterium]